MTNYWTINLVYVFGTMVVRETRKGEFVRASLTSVSTVGGHTRATSFGRSLESDNACMLTIGTIELRCRHHRLQ